MRKRKALIGLLVFLLISSIIFFIARIFLGIQETSARYAFISTGQTSFSTTPFYFDIACNNSSPCSNFTLPTTTYTVNFNLGIMNFIGSDFNGDDIDYQISISDGAGVHDAYDFSVDGVSAANDTITKTILGGSSRTDSLSITLTKTSPSSIDNNVYFTVSSVSPYTKSFTFVVTVDRQSLNFTVTGNPTNWTNQDVTLTVVPEASNITAYSFDNGATWQSSPSKTFSSNQTVYIKIRNSNGDTSGTVTENITKIDKTPPTINLPNRITITIGDSAALTGYSSVSDTQSGVDSSGVIFKKSNNTVVTNVNEFTPVGWYKIIATATDNVGNTNTVETSIMVHPPTGGHYVLFKQSVAGVGKNTGGTTSGLFQDNADTGADASCAYCSQYYYSGPTVDNYFSFAGSNKFRILNIPTNYDIKIIGNISSRTQRWSNSSIFSSSQYTAWQTWWNNRYIYYDSNDSNRLSFSATDATHIANATFYAGEIDDTRVNSIADIINSERTHSSGTGGSSASFTGHFAYPNVSDYLKAGNKQETIYDIDSASIANASTFRNSSWLGSGQNIWTMNGNDSTLGSTQFWALYYAWSQSGNRIYGLTTITSNYYQPVFYITEATILSGTGTSSDPFTVRENWDWFDNAQVLQ